MVQSKFYNGEIAIYTEILGSIPLRWPISGSVIKIAQIKDHQGLIKGTSEFTLVTDSLASLMNHDPSVEWSWIADPDQDHPKGMHS